MSDRAETLKRLESLACFRQSKENPLQFTCLAHFGLSAKGKLQKEWLTERGFKYHDIGSENVLYTMTFTDHNDAMLFKLSFI